MLEHEIHDDGIELRWELVARGGQQRSERVEIRADFVTPAEDARQIEPTHEAEIADRCRIRPCVDGGIEKRHAGIYMAEFVMRPEGMFCAQGQKSAAQSENPFVEPVGDKPLGEAGFEIFHRHEPGLDTRLRIHAHQVEHIDPVDSRAQILRVRSDPFVEVPQALLERWSEIGRSILGSQRVARRRQQKECNEHCNAPAHGCANEPIALPSLPSVASGRSEATLRSVLSAAAASRAFWITVVCARFVRLSWPFARMAS